MKITKIELNDFRAFANPETFELDSGNNLLLYGANGAGKSSLFCAVKEIFNHTSADPFSVHKNIFTDVTRTDGYVRLYFSGPSALGNANLAAEWPFSGPRVGGDQRIVQGAMRLGTLDYRDLLDTNYVFRNGNINLFDVLVNGILRPWLLTVAGRGFIRLGTLWDEATSKRISTWREQDDDYRAKGGVGYFRAKNQTEDRINAATNAANDFSTALRTNLHKIVLQGNRILRRLGLKTLSFVLNFHPVTYDSDDREFSPQQIDIKVRFNAVEIPRPQMFLNEARLSALAISLYFAALLKVVPDDSTWPRILVLDDILIGLDMENRLPLLDILRNEFRDWQIFLFTHDKAWFELAQIEVGNLDNWSIYETNAKPFDSGSRVFDVPYVRHPVRTNRELKSLADQHIASAKAAVGNDDRIAAFHARVAFECKLKSFCHNHEVPVRYDLEHGRLDTGDFLTAVEQHLKHLGTHSLARFEIQRVKLFRKGVLNPYAHFHPITISPSEVRMAIVSVDTLDLRKKDTDFCGHVASFQSRPALNQQHIIDYASWLRTAFEVDLRDMLVRLNGTLGFRHDWSKISLAELWDSAKIAMQARNGNLAAGLITDVETNRAVFIEDFNYSQISALGKAQLDTAWIALRDSAQATPVITRLATFQ